MSIDAARARVARAREQGTDRGLAEALAALAADLVPAGDLAAAREALDEASKLHADAGRAGDERHCSQFAATLSRLLGDTEGARARAARAAELSPQGSPGAISAHAELGETALASGNLEAAAAEFGDALRHADRFPLAPADRAALLRKQAAALEADDRTTLAVEALDEAYGVLEKANDHTLALRVRIEAITALQNAGRNHEADMRRAEAFTAARRLNDAHALADLELLESAAALAASDAGAALAAATRSREHALNAVAPVSYMAAAIAIAELHEAAGDKVAAYGALASGYATLGDLLGSAAASDSFGTKLAECRDRWGAQAFADAKIAYEAQRKRGLPAD